MNYSYLTHVEATFIDDEDEIGEEADNVLANFFQNRVGVQSRAFLEEDLRYIIVSSECGVEILEEDGDWNKGELEPKDANEYELIYEENGCIKTEDVEVAEARNYLH